MAKMGRPKEEDPRKNTLSFRLKDSDYKRIKEHAERCNMTITQIIEKAVEKYLDSPKK